MLDRLDAIRTTMLAVAQHNNHAKEHTSTALAETRRIGEGRPTPVGGSPPPVQESHPQDGADPRRDEAVPSHLRRVGEALPARTADGAPTEGFLVVGNNVVHDGLFSAEPDGRIRSRKYAPDHFLPPE
jgi:hypothetical protein